MNDYELREMNEEEMFRVLSGILGELGQIPPEEMTTFELNVLRAIAVNPPARKKGVEERLLK